MWMNAIEWAKVSKKYTVKILACIVFIYLMQDHSQYHLLVGKVSVYSVHVVCVV